MKWTVSNTTKGSAVLSYVAGQRRLANWYCFWWQNELKTPRNMAYTALICKKKTFRGIQTFMGEA